MRLLEDIFEALRYTDEEPYFDKQRKSKMLPGKIPT